MVTIAGPKYIGPLIIDLSPVGNDLIDLPPGAMRGIRGEQEGIEKVNAELAIAIPGYGDAAEIPHQVYKRFQQRTSLLAQLRTHERELEKALEVCRETRAKTENDREDDISIIAKTVQDTARRLKDPGIAAPFQETIRYNGQIAEKAMQTRRKNAEPKADAPKDDEPKADAPKADAPKTATVKADASKADAPKANASKTDAPKANASKAATERDGEQATAK